MQHARQEFILLSNISRSFDAGRPVNNRGGTGPIQRCSVRLLPGCSASSSMANMMLLREEDGPPLLVEGTVA
jgi:hypothetical protein